MPELPYLYIEQIRAWAKKRGFEIRQRRSEYQLFILLPYPGQPFDNELSSPFYGIAQFRAYCAAFMIKLGDIKTNRDEAA